MKEIKQEKKKQEKKKQAHGLNKMILLLLILLLLLLGFRCSYLKKEQQRFSEYEDKVNAITEIDYSDRQESLNAIVEEGKMNVNYMSQAVFQGTVSERFNIKNVKNNHYPIQFELYDEGGNCIYTSKKIMPGYEMTNIELEKELDVGVHACKLKVGYAEEGNISSVFPITIEVKEK